MIFWEFSLWTVDEVTQLISNEKSQRDLGKNKLELCKLLKEFYSFVFLSWRFWSFLGLQPKILLTKTSDPFSTVNWAIYRGFRDKTVPEKYSIMGVNSLITWAVIDLVMRAIIIETRALSLLFCHWGNAWETRTSSSTLSFIWGAGFGLCVWVLHGCLRRKFQALRFGHWSEVETRVSTLASWYYSGVETRLSSSTSWLL